jgi:hypothetical protein
MVLLVLRLLRRLRLVLPLQLHLLHLRLRQPIHSVVDNQLNLLHSDLGQAVLLLLRPRLPILSVPLLRPRLRLPLQLVDLGSASAPETTQQMHRLDSAVLLPPPQLLRLLSVSDNLAPRPPHPLPVLDSHSAELGLVHPLPLLNLHSVLETPRPHPYLLKMEVRPLLVNLEDSDLEVQHLEVRRLRMVDLVWVWNRVIHLVVPVDERSSLLGGVRSDSRICEGCKIGYRVQRGKGWGRDEVMSGDGIRGGNGFYSK